MHGQSSLFYEVFLHLKFRLCKEKDEILKLVWVSQVPQNNEKTKGIMALVYKKLKNNRYRF